MGSSGLNSSEEPPIASRFSTQSRLSGLISIWASSKTLSGRLIDPATYSAKRASIEFELIIGPKVIPSVNNKLDTVYKPIWITYCSQLLSRDILNERQQKETKRNSFEK